MAKSSRNPLGASAPPASAGPVTPKRGRTPQKVDPPAAPATTPEEHPAPPPTDPQSQSQSQSQPQPQPPAPPPPQPQPPSAHVVPEVLSETVPLVLIAHSDPALLRLVRESMEAFLHCEVRTTSSALAAFDRVLQEPYRLLLLDLHLPGLNGEVLYDLISRAYPRVHARSWVAPPVIWLGLPSDYPRQDELTREARTRALLTLPLNIQRLLSTAATLLPKKAGSHPG